MKVLPSSSLIINETDQFPKDNQNMNQEQKKRRKKRKKSDVESEDQSSIEKVKTDDTSNFPFQKSPITNEIVNDTNWLKQIWIEIIREFFRHFHLHQLQSKKERESANPQVSRKEITMMMKIFLKNQLHNVICGLMKQSVSSNLKIKSSKISFASVFINLKK